MSLDRLSTGVAGLDIILDGGLNRGSLLIIAGAPGTGKTILLQQLCFAWAANPDQGPALYFSVLSEPQEKLLRHLSQLKFYNAKLVGAGLQLFSLGAALEKSLEAAAEQIVKEARRAKASLVALDGLRGLEDVAPDRNTVRQFLYKLSAQLNILGVTCAVALERAPDDAENFGEFTTADAVLGLTLDTSGVQAQRFVAVRKARGQNPLLGRHSYSLSDVGWTVFPRLEALVRNTVGEEEPGEQLLSMGLPELDALLGGGLPAGSATLLVGSVGTGKTLLGLYFLQAGLAQGEAGLYLSFRESRGQLRATARRFGLAELTSEHSAIHSEPAVELNLDQVSAFLREQQSDLNACRLVIDQIDDLEYAATQAGRSVNFLAALHVFLRQRNATSLLLKSAPRSTGADFEIGELGLAQLCENLVLLRAITYQAQLYRVMAVVKMRDNEHDRSLREYTITRASGFQVLPTSESAPGLLAGISDQLQRNQGRSSATTNLSE